MVQFRTARSVLRDTAQQRGRRLGPWRRHARRPAELDRARADARRRRRDRRGRRPTSGRAARRSRHPNAAITSVASIAAARRIRDRSPRPSRSAATMNASAASESSSGSHAAPPARSLELAEPPAARRPDRGTRAAASRPIASTIDRVEVDAVTSARRARSIARSRKPTNGASIGGVVAGDPGHDTDPQARGRRAGRRGGRGGCRARRRGRRARRPASTVRRRPCGRVEGGRGARASSGRAAVIDPVVRVERAQVGEQRRGPVRALAAAAGR